MVDSGDSQLQAWTAVAIGAELGARGWSVNKLIEESGMAPSVMRRLLAGKRDMNFRQLETIAAALGVSPVYLVNEAQRRHDISTARSQ